MDADRTDREQTLPGVLHRRVESDADELKRRLTQREERSKIGAVVPTLPLYRSEREELKWVLCAKPKSMAGEGLQKQFSQSGAGIPPVGETG